MTGQPATEEVPLDSDLMMVVGVVLGILAIPALISAFSQSRPPRAAAILVMVASGLIVAAVWQKPSGYAIADLPATFERVINRLLR